MRRAEGVDLLAWMVAKSRLSVPSMLTTELVR
jgi:hypothetical protein